MLMRFNVKNFLSFLENQEFTMIAGSVRNKPDHLIKGKDVNLLRLATLYGANASGKSNLIKAMGFSKKVIIDGLDNSSQNKYFRLNKQSSKNPSSFEYEFKIGNKYYAFGFNVVLSESKITGEWLYELKPSGESLIYERDILSNEFKNGLTFKSSESRTRFEIYSEDIIGNDKELFLSEINRNKETVFEKYEEFKVFNEIYKWFYQTLDINNPDHPITSTEFYVDNDRSNSDKLFMLLDSLGTGITDFKLVKSTVEDLRRQFPPKLLKDIRQQLSKSNHGVAHIRSENNLHLLELDDKDNLEIKTMNFSHGKNGGDFALGEESDGTRRLLDLLEILLVDEDKVYVIDEIDRSLHPNLTYKFIELFLDFLKDKRIQLIITTHEDRLLDLELLRRDEIWFVEKSNNGSSDLFSLEKYKTRFDKKILNSYLEGRYGGIPKFKNIDFNS